MYDEYNILKDTFTYNLSQYGVEVLVNNRLVKAIFKMRMDDLGKGKYQYLTMFTAFSDNVQQGDEIILNNKQYEAVSSSKQYLRIIAGAGSGKTRVLTYRIAYLIENMNVYPDEILAITFTNKVANEMKERLARLVTKDYKSLLIKTFHSFSCYFLSGNFFLSFMDFYSIKKSAEIVNRFKVSGK